MAGGGRSSSDEAHPIILRDFAGVNLQAARESIRDEEFFWLENIIPLGAGNLVPTPGPGSLIVQPAGEVGAPSYTAPFTVGGTDYLFAVWSNSGNGWVGAVNSAGSWQKVLTGVLTSGQTAAVGWNRQGLLIIDPAGYWDWNVSAAGPTTTLSGVLQSLTLTNGGIGFTAVPTVSLSSGSGYLVRVYMGVNQAVIAAGGAGYVVGDVLTLSGINTLGGSPAPTLTVTGVTAGAITTLAITTIGQAVNIVANPIALLGGHGTGATVTINWSVTNLQVVTQGSGFTSLTPTVTFTGGAPTTGASATATTNFGFGGVAIAAYAGRVWTASGRVVTFTDAGSYNSFAGSGSAFTINDAYLHNVITALFAANNYLYIFGDSSIDVLSNVTVSGGVASFSRVNISASVGTTFPTSIFSYLRSVAFANTSGFFLLSGATPEPMGEMLSSFLQQVNFGVTIYGGQLTVQRQLCAAFLVSFADSFTQSGQTRTILAVFFRGKWWFASQGSLTLTAMVSIPTAGLPTLYGWSANGLYPLLSGVVGSWLVKTRFFDLGAPLREKQAINGAIGLVLAGLESKAGILVSIDTEITSEVSGIGAGSFPPITWVNNGNQVVAWQNNALATVTWTGTPAGYMLLQGAIQGGGSQYVGMTVSGDANTTQLRLLAMSSKVTRDMLR